MTTTQPPARATLWLSDGVNWTVEREDAPLATVQAVYRELAESGVHPTRLSIRAVGEPAPFVRR